VALSIALNMPLFSKQMEQIIDCRKPSRFSLFWFQNYFSSNPATVFTEDQVHYDDKGFLVTRSTRSYNYWISDSCCPTCHGPYSYWNCSLGGPDCNCGNCGGGDSIEALALFLVILVAFIAFIVACCIVFYYPPVMIISWLVLVIGSFTQSIVGFAPECFGIRWYNGASSIFIAMVTIFIIGSVFRLQNLYRGYYPGTPNVQVDVKGLMSLFRISRIFYVYFSIPSSCFLLAGTLFSTTCILTRSISFDTCPHLNSCRWTSYTMYCWIVIHGLNAVAALGMYQRMKEKYQKLKVPPAYEEVPLNGTDLLYPSLTMAVPARSQVEDLPSYTTESHKDAKNKLVEQ
jgi:hypothetical protein